MNIRKAECGDAGQIEKFQIEMARETENLTLDHAIVKAGVNAVFTDPSKGNYFIAEENGKIIGSLLTTFEWSDWRNGTVLWIQSVYVLPEYRRKGVYRALYSQIKSLVEQDNNLKGIRLYADKANTTAHIVYKAMKMTDEHYLLYEWLKN